MGGHIDQRFLSGLVAVDQRMVALLELKLLFDLEMMPEEATTSANALVN
jgi:hypothetical protein